MDKVMIQMLDGTKMLFPKEYAKKVNRKNELVLHAMFHQKMIQQNDGNREIYHAMLNKIMSQIRTLNRQIPPCGEVVR